MFYKPLSFKVKVKTPITYLMQGYFKLVMNVKKNAFNTTSFFTTLGFLFSRLDDDK